MVEPPVFTFSRRSSWRDIKNWFLSGHVAGFPAEYAYALSEVPTCRPLEDPLRLFRIKNRPEKKPVLYLAGSSEIVGRYARLPKDPIKVRFLLPPHHFVTLLLPARPLACALGMSMAGKVAFRIPSDPILRNFLVYLDEPVSGTSLNISGRPPLRSVKEIRQIFPDLAVIDGGFKPGSPVSPILDLTTYDRRILRGPSRRIFR